ISWAKPSSSPANRPSRFTNRLYAITEGTATARPPTVVTSASATPGATAAMFPEPPTAMPMKASITPSTVPSRPSSGLTEPQGGVVGVLETGRPLALRHEAVGLLPHAAELPPLQRDEIPRDQGEHDEDREHELGLAARGQHQLPGSGGNRSPDL